MGQLTFWPMDSWSMETAPVEREDPGARFHSMAVEGNIILALDRLERRGHAHSSGALALSRLEGQGGRITRLVNLEGPAQPASCLALHVAAGVAATASPTHPDIWLWSVPEGKPLILISDPLKAASIQDLAFSPDGRLLAVTGIHAVGSGGQTVVIDAITGCEIAGGDHAAWRVAWHPDGKALAVIEQRGQVAILDAQCQLIGRLRGITDAIQVLAFSTDGNWLVAAGEDRILRVWPAEGGKPVAALELSSHAGALRALPDPDQMAVLLSDGGVWVIDLPTLMEGHPA
jgi:WD40 repeat protein